MMKQKNEQFTVDELIMVLNHVKDAVFIEDKDGITIWCNRACEKLYQIRREDIVGISAIELEKKGVFSPSVTAKVLAESKEVTIVHENKAGKRLLTTGTPVLDSAGTIFRIITTSRDITELSNLQNELVTMQNAIDELKGSESDDDSGVVAVSQAMQNVLLLAKRLADVSSTVLITGESGVGKGLIARYLHNNGSRKSKPFIAVNCGAIPETLIESELFGYEPGAFTGSRAEGKKGLFEEAQGGTIFLDEISELPLNLQVKLLQIIQEREFKKVGGVKSIPVDIRIISATNKELRALVEAGRFREDLYYRLNVVPLNVPPIRERREDILPLIQKTLRRVNSKLKDSKAIDPETMAILLTYQWPGNVREIENIIERLVITTRDHVILPENLPAFLFEKAKINIIKTSEITLKEAVEQAEKEILAAALQKHGSTRAMSKALDVSQPTIVRKLAKYKIKTNEI